MKARITRFDEELLEMARRFLAAGEDRAESRAVLERYGYTEAERLRGRTLIGNAAKSFEWERSGTAWNFLSPTPERRRDEARHWYRDTRRRYMRDCFRAAELESHWFGDGRAPRWGLGRKLTVGLVVGLRHGLRMFSIAAWRDHRAELRRNLEKARGEKPADAPPPKDTALVELAGWYERFRLLAQRVFRGRPDLLTPYGLTVGKAPPRLRGKLAQIRFGERAAGTLAGAPVAEVEEESGLEEA
jgi:hypothetical protein